MLRLQSAPTRVKDWLDQAKIDYAYKYLIPPIRMININEGRSENFANLWDVEDTGYLTMDLVNHHERAMQLELGWEPFVVFPKGKANGGADVLRFEIDGEVIFATHAFPQGFKGYHTIEKAQKQKVFLRYFQEMIKGANEWMDLVRMK